MRKSNYSMVKHNLVLVSEKIENIFHYDKLNAYIMSIEDLIFTNTVSYTFKPSIKANYLGKYLTHESGVIDKLPEVNNSNRATITTLLYAIKLVSIVQGQVKSGT